MSEQEGQESLGHRLGRLYAVYEQLDAEANQRERGELAVDEIEASVQPSLHFPKLMQEGQEALRKLKAERRGYYNKLFTDLYNLIPEFPEAMSPREKNDFSTGFYKLFEANEAERERQREERQAAERGRQREERQAEAERGRQREERQAEAEWAAKGSLERGFITAMSILGEILESLFYSRLVKFLFLPLVLLWVVGQFLGWLWVGLFVVVVVVVGIFLVWNA